MSDESVKPVQDVRDLAVDGFFESDEELDEFLHFYRDQRQADAR
jgi:hypothetical protein